MHVTLINPPILRRKLDFTSVLTMPLGLAYLAAYLSSKSVDVTLIDATGEAIDRSQSMGRDGYLVGVGPETIPLRIDPGTDAIGLSVSFSSQHGLYVAVVRHIKKALPGKPLVIGGHHATLLHDLFLQLGVDIVVMGEGEHTFHQVCVHLHDSRRLERLPGIAYRRDDGIQVNEPVEFIQDVDSLPFPARGLFPLESYWRARLGHGPVNDRYTPILSSRGCRMACAFCSSAVFWRRVWRARTPGDVLAEIEHCRGEFGIREFHFEDDNLTLDRERAIQIFAGIIERNLDIAWCLPNGVRPDHLDRDMLSLMREAGCRHITLAPESGSADLRKTVFNKVVDIDKVKEVVATSHELGIATQAFFITRAPGETDRDRASTRRLIRELAELGLDEIAVMNCNPYPGTRLAETCGTSWQGLLTTGWGTDSLVQALAHGNFNPYIEFLFAQLRLHPDKCTRLFRNLWCRRQDTKYDRVLASLLHGHVRSSA